MTFERFLEGIFHIESWTGEGFLCQTYFLIINSTFLYRYELNYIIAKEYEKFYNLTYL